MSSPEYAFYIGAYLAYYGKRFRLLELASDDVWLCVEDNDSTRKYVCEHDLLKEGNRTLPFPVGGIA